MKYLIITILFFTQVYASLDSINSFEADFTQSVTDEKNKVLVYSGHVIASKPQKAVWNYTKPIEKNVYINAYSVVIVEPEIEQVIVKRIKSNFDFFNMIKNAKRIKENTYEATYKNTIFTIISKNSLIQSILYKDEFDNNVKIIFKKQIQNKNIDDKKFIPDIPMEYDVIRD